MLHEEVLQLLQQVLVTDSLPSGWVHIALPVGLTERIYDPWPSLTLLTAQVSQVALYGTANVVRASYELNCWRNAVP